jgi:uncharacterized cupredoxin-like copper-binding protein
MVTRRIGAAVIAAAAVAAVAGCGSSNSDDNGGAASTPATSASTSAPSTNGGMDLKLQADPSGQLSFDKTKLTAAKPGKVTVQMMNPASAGQDHGIAITGQGVNKDGPIVAAGKTATITVDLKKGSYTYFCPVPGHEQAGMKGTLTVG